MCCVGEDQFDRLREKCKVLEIVKERNIKIERLIEWITSCVGTVLQNTVFKDG